MPTSSAGDGERSSLVGTSRWPPSSLWPARGVSETYDLRLPGPDVAGTVLLTFGLVAIVSACPVRARASAARMGVGGSSEAGVAALAALVVVERRQRDEGKALLPTSLFRFRRSAPAS